MGLAFLRRQTWTQFSLRGLLVFMVVAGIVSLLIGQFRPLQRFQQIQVRSDYLSLIETLEGEPSLAPNAVTQINFRGRPLTDKEFAGLAAHPGAKEIVMLDLSASWITDESLKYVKLFPNLRGIALNHCYVSDAGLRYLHGHPTLRGVSVIGTQVTEEGAEALRRTHPAFSITLNSLRLGTPTKTRRCSATFKATMATRVSSSH
jgi:hypothetical protein